ncbi:MAG: hypothetical protein WC626_10555 [Methanoregula sp.]
MPQLRNLRIINAQFNEGHNVYEDFRMPFHGFNTTFELVNGGGKSVLLMLLMQCILPRAALTKDHPFVDMFHGGDPNRTTHVLAEWELEKSISEKKYLLTGFCAKRKIAQDDDSRSDEIQSFNYIYNYNKSNIFDINNLPLCNFEDKAFVVKDFSKTLSMMKEKSAEYDIRITEKRREYQDWLKEYCLLESEWNLIREINKGENHLKPHFANYKTSRNLVEGLLIKTIEECLKDRERLNYNEKSDESSTIADALFKSQESLKKLQEEQDTLINYEKLLFEVGNLSKANERLIGSYESYREEKNVAAAQLNAYEISLHRNEDEIQDIIEKLKNMELSQNNLKYSLEKISLDITNVQVNQAKKIKDQYDRELAPLEIVIKEQTNFLNFSKAVNKYLLIKDKDAAILENEMILTNKKENRRDLYEKLNPLGKSLYDRISYEITQLNARKISDEKNLREIDEKIILELKEIGGKQKQLSLNKTAIENLNNKRSSIIVEHGELSNQYKTYPQISTSLFTEDKIESVTKYLVRLAQEKQDLSDAIDAIKDQISQKNSIENELKTRIIFETESIDRVKNEFAEFQSRKENTQKILNAYEKNTPESCLAHIGSEIQKFSDNLVLQKSKLNSLNQQLDSIQKYGYSLDESFIKSLGIMKDRYPQSVSGAEHLNGLTEEKRGEILELAPWLPKTILVLDQYFKEITRTPYALPVEIQDVAPLIANLDLLRANRAITLGDIFIPHRETEFLKEVFAGDKTIARIKKELARAGEAIIKIESSIHNFKQDQYIVRSFLDRYPSDAESVKRAEIEKYTNSLKEHKEKMLLNQRQKDDFDKDLIATKAHFEENKERTGIFEKSLRIIQKIKENEDHGREFQKELDDVANEQKELNASLRRLDQEHLTSQTELQIREESLRQTNEILSKYQTEIRDYQSYAGNEIRIPIEGDINEIRSKYRAAKKVIDDMDGTVGQIESTIKSDRSSIDVYRKDIHDLGIEYGDLITRNPDTPNSDDFIQQLQERIIDLGTKRNIVYQFLERAITEYEVISRQFTQKIDHYQKLVSDTYNPNSELFDSNQFIVEFAEKTKQIKIIEEQIGLLKEEQLKKESNLKTVQKGFFDIRVLDATHHFKNSMCIPADVLRDPQALEVELERAEKVVRKNKKQSEIVKATAIQNVSDIPIASEFKEIIKVRLKEADSLQDAELNQQQLNNFSQIIHEKIEIHHKTIEALKEVEEKIVNQALGMARIYRDHLKEFPQMSKLEINEKHLEMIRINFDECIFEEERAQVEMRRYIQDLNKGIRDGIIKRPELQKSFRPEQLVARLMEMGKIQVKIRKIEEESQGFQKWDSIKASDGQENTMYIIFLIALMSYIRNIVVGRYDTNTSKVLLLDNPFGSTGAFYLWAPIWSILKRNNIQLICSGHKISSKIREFFPVNCILTEDIAKSGLKRVNIKVEARGEAKEIISRSQPKNILQWTGS